MRDDRIGMFGGKLGNEKCHAYLAGISLTLVVDHQPLVQIFNGYSLDQVENPRLLRLLMKTRTSFMKKEVATCRCRCLVTCPGNLTKYRRSARGGSLCCAENEFILGCNRRRK